MITPAHKRALNRALHELRRPLQALVLMEEDSPSPPPRRRPPAGAVCSRWRPARCVTWTAPSTARRPRDRPGRFSCREVVLAALERWRPLAARMGGIRVYWDAGPAPVEGDAVRMAQALDNLISNALEHGGPPVVVTGARVAARIRVTIANGAPGRVAEPRAAIRAADMARIWSRRSRARTAAASRSAAPAAAASRRSSCRWRSRVTRWRREPPQAGGSLPGRGPRLRAARSDGRRPVPLAGRGALRAAAAGASSPQRSCRRESRSRRSGWARRWRCGGSRRASSRPVRWSARPRPSAGRPARPSRRAPTCSAPSSPCPASASPHAPGVGAGPAAGRGGGRGSRGAHRRRPLARGEPGRRGRLAAGRARALGDGAHRRDRGEAPCAAPRRRIRARVGRRPSRSRSSRRSR